MELQIFPPDLKVLTIIRPEPLIYDTSSHPDHFLPPDLQPKKSERDAIRGLNMVPEETGDGEDTSGGRRGRSTSDGGGVGAGEDPGLESTLRRFFHLHALKKVPEPPETYLS